MSVEQEAGFDHHGDVSVDETLLSAELPGSGRVASPEVAEYATRLGDDALILSQQLGWWISRAPELEEDMAIGNIALDLLGHARALLHFAGTATGRSEDDMAYWRDEPEFLNCWLVEQECTDFGDMIACQLYFSAYQVELYRALESSADESLAAIAAKALREVSYHLDHAVAEAGLETPVAKPAACGGRQGRHSTLLGYIVTEMQWLSRRHPGAKW